MSPPAQQTSSSLPSASAAPAVAELVAAGHDAGEEAAAAIAEAYERTHVHGVYEAIAPHFSSTRYKPWPAVAQFLHAQRPGSVGLDVGCGNGKYLGVNPAVYMVGSDRSSNLVALAKSHRQLLEKGGSAVDDGAATTASQGGSSKKKNKKNKQGSAGEAPPDAPPNAKEQYDDSRPAVGTDLLVADGLSLPFRDRSADFAICVAVVHHLSTRARRQDAIRQLLRCVRAGHGTATSPDEIIGRGGTVLVYVWALEQGNSRRGWDEGGEQDLLVPWVMKKSQAQAQGKLGKQKRGAPAPGLGPEDKGKDTAIAATAVTASRSDKSGVLPQEVMSSADAAGEAAGKGETADPDPSTVFNRYYHLYRNGELKEDVLAAGGVVVKSGYERDNWWVVCANGRED